MRKLASFVVTLGLLIVQAPAADATDPLRHPTLRSHPLRVAVDGVSGPTGSWTEVPRTWPAPTSGAGAAYDEARDELLYFGGCCFKDKTWLLDEAGWRVAPVDVGPGGRAGPSMAYDAARREVVMFGGTQQGETWTWDGAKWNLEPLGFGPQFRADSSMTYMPKIGKVVMFGGTPEVDGTQLSDTWTWDGQSWTRVEAATSPPGRYGAGLEVDPATGNLILFGGLSDTYSSLDDTWLFDGSNWSRVDTPTAPSPRSYVQMVSFPELGAIALFGGYHLESVQTSYDASILGDLWWFKDGDWSQLIEGADLAGGLPPSRLGGTFEYLSDSHELVLVGGSCVDPCGGLWRLSATLPDGPGDRSVISWAHQQASVSVDRMAGGIATLTEGVLMFGGFGDLFGNGAPQDTWMFADGSWNLLDTEHSPPATPYASLATDLGTDSAILFGGCVDCANPSDRTWMFSDGDWQEVDVQVRPEGRRYSAMSSSPRGGVVLFGGLGSGDRILGDTWTFENGSWVEQRPATSPPARTYAQMAFDPVHDQTILFGGKGAGGTTLNDTWVWDGASWTQLMSPASPPPLMAGVMAWDPVGGHLVLTTGATCASAACVVANHLWIWDGTTWLPQPAAGGPPVRWFALGASVPGGILVFGGHDGGSQTLSDTWLWSGS